MRNYYRILPGRKNCYAQNCRDGNFIGVDFKIQQSLEPYLFLTNDAFVESVRPLFMRMHPDKSKVSAGLACGTLYTVAVTIKQDDIVLCRNQDGNYWIGEVSGAYYYAGDDEPLPHRRPVRWLTQVLDKEELSEALRNSCNGIGTLYNISSYSTELETLIHDPKPQPVIVALRPDIEDPMQFALEQHLEDFLIRNWPSTDLGKNYDLYEDEETGGRQFPVDTGRIDILAISKDRKEILVVELKRGKASDVVVGQTLRYMGYVQSVLAEEGQSVRGVIVASEDDLRLRRALEMVNLIDFYRYRVSFQLIPST